MWQVQYHLHMMRMRELEAEADRRRRWQLEDRWNSRPTATDRAPNRARAGAARAAGRMSRAAARFAWWLDGRVVVERGSKRVLRDT